MTSVGTCANSSDSMNASMRRSRQDFCRFFSQGQVRMSRWTQGFDITGSLVRSGSWRLRSGRLRGSCLPIPDRATWPWPLVFRRLDYSVAAHTPSTATMTGSATLISRLTMSRICLRHCSRQWTRSGRGKIGEIHCLTPSKRVAVPAEHPSMIRGLASVTPIEDWNDDII